MPHEHLDITRTMRRHVADQDAGLITPPGSFNRWLILVSVGLSIATITMDNSMLNVTLPALATAFAVEPDLILWLVVAGTLVSVGLALTWGSLGDSIGRRRLHLTGFLFFTVGLVILSISQNLFHLICGRVIQAVGLSMIVTNGFAIAVAAFPEPNRGKVIGIVSAFVGLGLAAGPIAAGIILDTLGWRGTFFTRIPLGMLVMGLNWLVLPKDKANAGLKHFDYQGAIALFIALVSLLLVVNRLPHLGITSIVILGLVVTALVSGVMFAILELRASKPVVDFSLFQSRFLCVSIIVHFLYFNGYTFLVFLLPFYLIEARGLTAMQTGLLIAILQATRMFASPFSGWFTDRLGPRIVATLGLVCAALGLWILSGLDDASSVYEIVFGLVLAGTGSAIFDPSNDSAVIRGVAQEHLSSAIGMTTTARQVGFSIGTGLAGTIYAARLRLYSSATLGSDSSQAAIREATALSYQEVILIGFGILLVTACISLLRGSDRRQRAP
jgi:EmrB/QacA subfamily drug resistance transporter